MLKYITAIALALSSWIIPAIAIAEPELRNPDYTSETIIIKNDAITKPEYIPPAKKDQLPRSTPSVAGRHPTRAQKAIAPDVLRNWLSEHSSPLAESAEQIANSPYYGTIIGICWIEQHRCTRAPSFNYWGIMGKTGLQKYPNMESGIAAVDALLARYEAKGNDTVEKMNCIYVQPCSANWESTVIKIKTELENLTP